jgi:hypothetical protein
MPCCETRRDAPLSCLEIDLVPLGLAPLARPHGPPDVRVCAERNPLLLAGERYLKRHQRLPVGAISSYRPRPSNKRTVTSLDAGRHAQTSVDE